MNQDQQIPSEGFIQKFGQLQLSETDDDMSRQGSPQLDSRFYEIAKELPPIIRQRLNNFQPNQHFQLCKLTDDSVYYGVIEQGLKHGMGIQMWPKAGNLLEGSWVNDQLEGICRMNYSNGDIFEATFSQGRTNGFGIFKSAKKIVKGIWIDNMLQGEGQEIKSDGNKYYGQFSSGRKEGRGIYYFTDGCKYEGWFKNNHFHGEGIFYWSDGSYYSGQFNKGLIFGFGNYVNDNGVQLAGQFQEIKKSEVKDCNLNNNLQQILFLNQYNQTLLIEKIHVL